jgi:hypothetical protein
MTRKYGDPEAPEVLEAVIERIRRMTRDEWVQELAWHPEGAQETWRMRPTTDPGWTEGTSVQPVEAMTDDASLPGAERVALSGQGGRL